MLDLYELSPQSPLIILDLANNHNGSVEHAKRIIDGIQSAASGSGFTIALKLQYRDLDTFIHPNFVGRDDLHYVKRFLSTRLTWEQFQEVTDYAKSRGFLTSATPFDQSSVSFVEGHGHDFLKIASASFTDWPLWERVAETSLPLVVSTAGASLEDIDRVVSFLDHRSRQFALMHCVAAYPTADSDLLLDRIDVLRSRYPHVPVGFSTHENPSNDLAGPLALAKGASLLERHIGQGADGSPLNAYSSEPSVIQDWLSNLRRTTVMLGGPNAVGRVNAQEQEALAGLRRGVFVKSAVPAGHVLRDDEVFFAIPLSPGQVTANEWSKYSTFTTRVDLAPGSPVLHGESSLEDKNVSVLSVVTRVAAYLDQAGITYPQGSQMEISHHQGLADFDSVGMTMITVVNREYCKKLLIMLPGQEHPEQWHKVKEETFHVLHGQLTLWLDGEGRDLSVGDIAVVEPGVRHKFRSDDGCIIEEISTRHEGLDSFYTDERIMTNPDRKTFVTFWGGIAS